MRQHLTFTPRAAVLLVILLCLVGAWFRFYNLGTASLWIDEGYTVNSAHAVLKHGYPLLDSGDRADNGLLSVYSVAGVLTLSPLDPFNPWAARLPAALAGIGVIAATYAFARRLFNGYFIALLSAGLMALMKWEIAWSQQSRGYTMLTLFLLLTSLFVWKFLQERRLRDVVFAGVMYIGAWMSHQLAFAFLPGFVFIVVAYLGARKLKGLRTGEVSLLFAGVVIGTWFGLVVMTRISPFPFIGYIPYYSHFLFVTGPVFLSASTVLGIVLGCFDRNRVWPLAFLASVVLLSTLIIIGYSNQLQFRYLFPLIPFFTITGVYALVRLAEVILRFLPIWSQHAVGGAVFLFLSLQLLTFIPRAYYALEIGSPQPAFDAVYRFLEPLVHGDDVVLSAYPHLNRIYLNNDGMWLAMSLTGRWSDITEWIEKDKDRYVGARAVAETREFEEVISSGSGYIILDTMTRRRRPDVVERLQNNPNTPLVFVIRTSLNDTMTVYQFREFPVK